MRDSIWELVRECFEADDGSLPSIEIVNLSPTGVAAVYAMLRRRSRLTGEPPEFWSRQDEASLPIDSVPNAAAMVAANHADAFHHTIAGLVAGGVELPVLGVFVWSNCVELDYRMGPEWGPAEVAGFFELLRDCCEIEVGAAVLPADSEGPPYPDRFMRAWSLFR